MTETKNRKPDLTDRAFRIGLILKALNGLAEIIGGVLLLIVSPQQINAWAASWTADELSRNPHDFIATHILKSAHDLTGSGLIFGAVYLLSHGIAKLVLVVEVLRDRLWAYPALIVLLGLFIIYQLYRIIFVHAGIGIISLTVLDVILVYLTLIEYRRHKAWHEQKHPAASDS